MVNFKASHWSRALLVFFPIHIGVEGFVIYGWDLSNLGYSPYMTNLSDKTYTVIIRDVFHHSTVVYRGPYSTNPGDKLRPIWFVTSRWDLSYMGGVCHIWVVFVKCGGVCHIWVGFVKYGLLYTTVL